MEHCGGHSLENYIKHKLPISHDLLRYYTDGLLEALDYLHKKAVVHKYLKVNYIHNILSITQICRINIQNFYINAFTSCFVFTTFLC